MDLCIVRCALEIKTGEEIRYNIVIELKNVGLFFFWFLLFWLIVDFLKLFCYNSEDILVSLMSYFQLHSQCWSFTWSLLSLTFVLSALNTELMFLYLIFVIFKFSWAQSVEEENKNQPNKIQANQSSIHRMDISVWKTFVRWIQQ